MTILYISYWGVSDPLTVATVFPHLQILQSYEEVQEIVFVSIEREAGVVAFEPGFPASKIEFNPLYSRKSKINLLEKIDDFVFFPKRIIQICQEKKIDKIIGRGAPAGALAYLVWTKLKVPFYVESFEPHANYMLESGVWRSIDPRYIFQQYWEKKQKVHASGLMPVSENYKKQLLAEKVSAKKICTAPVAVNPDQFSYDYNLREQVREELRFGANAIIGIYVGKFGGIYYNQEAFEIFKAAFNYFGENFRLIILTPTPVNQINLKLNEVHIDLAKVFVAKVAHHEVPAFLSASDFAFSTIKPAPSRIYCSPTKNGEYWANGLPILLTTGVGDDSVIVETEGGGAIFDLMNPDSVLIGLKKINDLIQQPTHREETRNLALKYRTLDHTVQAYNSLLFNR